MATTRTQLTELATAAGMLYDPSQPWPGCLEQLDIPGIEDATWKPVVLAHTGVGDADKDLLQRALANGNAFRQTVLKGRRPERIEWTGSAKSTWLSDIPRDLVIDHVWFVQAKYDSSCVLNTSPGALVDSLLAEDGREQRLSWFEEVASNQLQDYYEAVSARLVDVELPGDVRDLDGRSRDVLKAAMRSTVASQAEDEAYARLCRAVSIETVLRWRHRLEASSAARRTQMLFRMLRIAGGPYWVLGVKGARPVRLSVTDTRAWRERYELKRFSVTDAHAGQPQVDWRAEILDHLDSEMVAVEGRCEIRWSHGKLQGNPECKVQVATSLDQIPGYAPLG